MKPKKELIIAISINGKERMAVSYAVSPETDIREKCHELTDLMDQADSIKEAIALVIVNLKREKGYVYGMSEKAREAEREELRKQYGISLPKQEEVKHESGLMIFREGTIQAAKKECDILAEICFG